MTPEVYRQLRKVSEAASFETLALATAVAHCRVTNPSESSAVQLYLGVARDTVERRTGRALIDQTWELATNSFCAPRLTLGRAPVSSITSIQYYDESNSIQTLSSASYSLIKSEDASGVAWFDPLDPLPQLYNRPDAVKATFVAGSGSTLDSIPKSLVQPVLFLTHHLYDLRAPVNIGNIVTEIPHTLEALILMNRIGGFSA